MGLRDFRRAYPSQLSGGMRQRVCIARTLVLQPRLILLDEPFGALDQQTRLLMGDELLRLWRETSATVLLITHALDEANLLSDRIGVMSARPGRFIDIVETGWPRERDSRLAEGPDFGAVTARLWSLLRGESLRAMEQGSQAAMKKATWIRTVVLLGAVGALEVACRTGAIPATMVIAPSAMVVALVKMLRSDDIGGHIEQTLSAVAIAMSLAIAAAS